MKGISPGVNSAPRTYGLASEGARRQVGEASRSCEYAQTREKPQQRPFMARAELMLAASLTALMGESLRHLIQVIGSQTCGLERPAFPGKDGKWSALLIAEQ